MCKYARPNAPDYRLFPINGGDGYVPASLRSILSPHSTLTAPLPPHINTKSEHIAALLPRLSAERTHLRPTIARVTYSENVPLG